MLLDVAGDIAPSGFRNSSPQFLAESEEFSSGFAGLRQRLAGSEFGHNLIMDGNLHTGSGILPNLPDQLRQSPSRLAD